ncbi:hypothetical protein L1887_42568 [Cichorium endivia]|nr:hypothetical protein L1887_42568 [Cichorium endivia]
MTSMAVVPLTMVGVHTLAVGTDERLFATEVGILCREAGLGIEGVDLVEGSGAAVGVVEAALVVAVRLDRLARRAGALSGDALWLLERDAGGARRAVGVEIRLMAASGRHAVVWRQCGASTKRRGEEGRLLRARRRELGVVLVLRRVLCEITGLGVMLEWLLWMEGRWWGSRAAWDGEGRQWRRAVVAALPCRAAVCSGFEGVHGEAKEDGRALWLVLEREEVRRGGRREQSIAHGGTSSRIWRWLPRGGAGVWGR